MIAVFIEIQRQGNFFTTDAVKCENQIYIKLFCHIISHVGLSELSHTTW